MRRLAAAAIAIALLATADLAAQTAVPGQSGPLRVSAVDAATHSAQTREFSLRISVANAGRTPIEVLHALSETASVADNAGTTIRRPRISGIPVCGNTFRICSQPRGLQAASGLMIEPGNAVTVIISANVNQRMGDRGSLSLPLMVRVVPSGPGAASAEWQQYNPGIPQFQIVSR